MSTSILSGSMCDPSFDIDGMLGGLAKWLRIVGFDAAYPCKAPRPGRIFVTAIRKKYCTLAVYVAMDEPLAQLKEVRDQAGVTIDAARVLSRCLRCNEPVHPVSKDLAIGQVPDEILRGVSAFTQCPSCGRVYWEGSHRARIENRLALEFIEQH
jgi:uncharacterized protein